MSNGSAAASQLSLPEFSGRVWRQIKRSDPRGRALADRHYSRQKIGTPGWSPPGEHFALLTEDGHAVWAAVRGLDPAGTMRWRVTIFRREDGAARASELVREATELTVSHWTKRGCVPAPKEALSTEVDPERTRAKRDPGRCFRKAGWRALGLRNGLIILVAPGEIERGAVLPAVEAA